MGAVLGAMIVLLPVLRVDAELLMGFDSDVALIEALGDLTNAPAMRANDVNNDTTNIAPGETKAIFFDALNHTGSPTRVYAYLGIPAGASASNQVPAVVLVHGGGGTADKDWVAKWTNRGYAAISIAVEGQTDFTAPPTIGTGWHKHAMAGPERVGIYGDTALALSNQWMYHAVADTVLANSLLRSLPMVNSNKVGMMGISWGGVIVSTVMGLDYRFAFAIPVYGCGHKYDIPNQYGASLENNSFYRTKWDPILRISNAAMPALWFSWPQELNFSLDSQAATYLRAPGPRMVSLIPNLGHGGVAAATDDSYAFADSIISNGTPWCVQNGLSLVGNTATVTFTSSKTLDQARLLSTTGSGHTGSLPWSNTVATLVSNGGGSWTATATLPPNTKGWFINVLNGELVASSDYQENIALQFTPSGGLDLDISAGGGQSTGSVLMAYLAPSYVEISSMTLAGQSHPGSFTLLTAAPLVMKNPSPATEAVRFHFDNAVAGLVAGQSATGLLVVAWERLDGTTGQTQLPVRATIRLPTNVIYGVTANWSSKQVYGIDTVLVRSNATVSLDQSAMVGSLTVNDESSPTTARLLIGQAYDLTVNGTLSIGAGSGEGVVTQSAGTVNASVVRVNADGAGDPSRYDLASGTLSVASSLVIHTGGTVRVFGGTLSPNVAALTNNGELVIDGGTFSRSITGTTPVFSGAGTLRLKSGSFSLTGGAAADMTSINVALFEMSGGSLTIEGQQLLGAGAEFRIVGDQASISMQRFSGISSGTFRFMLDETGVSPVNVTYWAYLGSISIAVDGTAYNGGPTNITLIDSTNLLQPFNTNKLTVTGFAGYTYALVQDVANCDCVQLVLTSMYDTWASGYGLSGTNSAYDADPEGDGIANGFEYAIGGNPTDAGDEGLLPRGHAMPGGMEYVYRRHTNAAALGLNYLVQQATNLHAATWVTNGCEEIGHGTAGDGFNQVTNRIDAGASGGTAVRLRVDIVE